MNIQDVPTMAKAYLTCAAWADVPEGTDKDYPQDASAFDEESRDRAEVECAAFLYRALPWLDKWTPEQAGHDFWLTRNGHGSGFWDRGFEPEEYGEILTKFAKSFGELGVSVSNDGEHLITC